MSKIEKKCEKERSGKEKKISKIKKECEKDEEEGEEEKGEREARTVTLPHPGLGERDPR